MALLEFPSEIEDWVSSISMNVVHPGQVSSRGLYTGVVHVFDRGPGFWAGQISFGVTQSGSAMANQISAFFESLEGIKHWVALPTFRGTPTVEALAGLTVVGAGTVNDQLVTNFSRDTDALVIGEMITINSRLFQIVSGTGSSRVLSPQVPLTTGVQFPVLPGLTVIARRENASALLVNSDGDFQDGLAFGWAEWIG